MPPIENSDHRVCTSISQKSALRQFATFSGTTQSQQHIKPLHWYVACRLVVEGGFHPDDITPHPPFSVARKGQRFLLAHTPNSATGGEATVLGGLKTKNVDVVALKAGLGPVMAISCKGMTGAFRNLTNRMEETIGECTNLHITYPAMAFGYLFAVRANRRIEEAVSTVLPESTSSARQLSANDIALQKGGDPVESIIRFHAALRELTGRRGIRNDVSRYEAVSLAMVEMADATAGDLLQTFPPAGSPLRLEEFFKTLYLRYDERFVYSAPDLKTVTERICWAPNSPALSEPIMKEIDYLPRLDAEPDASQ
jgi:hypothetical protein